MPPWSRRCLFFLGALVGAGFGLPAHAATAQLTANRAGLVSRNLTIIEPPAPGRVRVIDGPHGDLKAFTAAAGPLDITTKLPFELPGRGSLLFWFRTEAPFVSGIDVPTATRKLVTLPGALAVSLKTEPTSATLLVHWEGPRAEVFERHIRVILPRLPGPAWHHVAVHWDGAKGESNAFLNGTPYYLPGETMPPLPIKPTSEVIAHLDGALADVRVDTEPFDPRRLRAIIGAEHFGTRADLLGGAELPAFSVAARRGPPLYAAPLADPADTRGWVLEGPAVATHEDGWLRLRSRRPEGPEGHLVYWCPEVFPESFIAEWDFELLEPRGLCIVFFAARGREGRDLFDPLLAARHGVFTDYTRGELDAYHISYFANTPAVPRAVANLRKNHGFYLLANGPVGVAAFRAGTSHHAVLFKDGARIRMSVDGRTLIDHTDDATRAGPVLTAGRIGFRQMQWTDARYRDFRVHAVRD